MALESGVGLLGSWPEHFVDDELENFKHVLLENGGTVGLVGVQEFASDFKSQPPMVHSPRMEEDDFEAWMDEKVDLEKLGLSVMDFDVPGGILDDLLAMDGLPSELGPSMLDTSPAKPESLNLFPPVMLQIDKVPDTINNEVSISPGCTPPDSPCALVPEIPILKLEADHQTTSSIEIPNLLEGFPWVSCVTHDDLLTSGNSGEVIVPEFQDMKFDDMGYLHVSPTQNDTSNSNVIVLLGPETPATSIQEDEISLEMPDAGQGDSDSGVSSIPVKKQQRGKNANGKSGRRAVSEATRRERKKNQNKDAATRYRYKKRAELQLLLDEETVLLGKNSELTEKVQKLSNEISYLKNLMREVFKAKGLLK